MRSLALSAGLVFSLLVTASPIAAQNNSKPQKATKPITAKVTNKRDVAVRSLQIIPAEAEVEPVNALKQPLGKNKTVTIAVKGPKGECNFIIVGEYEDGLEIAGGEVNLCQDNNIVLVD